MLRHDAVADAGVIGVPDEEAGELPRAFVVRKPGKEVTEKTLQDFVAGTCNAIYRLIDDLRCHVIFNSISVISGRWASDNEKPCAVELRLQFKKIFVSNGSRTGIARSKCDRSTIELPRFPVYYMRETDKDTERQGETHTHI